VAVLDSGHLPHRLIEQARHAIVGVSFAHRLRRCRRAANRGSSPAVHRRLALCRAREQNTRQLFTAIFNCSPPSRTSGYLPQANVAAATVYAQSPKSVAVT
jgi:hypothetical protein